MTCFLYDGMYDFSFYVNTYTFSNSFEEVAAHRIDVEVKFPILPYDTGYTTGFT